MTYDPRNNDTYIEKYSNSMVLDVEIHMFKNDSASTVYHGIRGDFSEESKVAAKNSVLHFPTAKELGDGRFKLLKYNDVKTLIPMSLMNRYEKKANECAYTQKTPLFFDLENEKFVIPLDKRFLRDLDLTDKDKFNELVVSKENCEIKEGFLLFKYDKVEEAIKDETKLIEDFNNLYSGILIKNKKVDDVILISFALKENTWTFSDFVSRKFKVKEYQAENVKLNLEFVKAKPISETSFFLYDDKDELIISSPVIVNKEFLKRTKTTDIIENASFFVGEQKDVLVIPYSEKAINTLKTIKSDLFNIFADLNKVFNKQKSISGLDKSLQLLDFKDEANGFLQIENKSNKKGANNV